MTLLPRFSKAGNAAEPRILAYCTSNIGLGPFARVVRVLQRVKQQRQECSILVITDARDTSLAQEAGMAVLALPRFQFTEGHDESPEHLRIANSELRNIRSGIIAQAAKEYQPHLFFMDSNPHGKRDEALPALKLRGRSAAAKTCLMMRDIPALPDGPFKLRGSARIVKAHASYYDKILIAGDKRFFDVAAEYSWPKEVTGKLHYCGFIVPEPRKVNRKDLLAPFPKLDPKLPLVTVTFGGGWESAKLTATFLHALELINGKEMRVQMLISTGPAIEEREFRKLTDHCGPGAAIVKFTTELPELLASSDALVLQAGSTVFQGMRARKPMLLLVRDYKNKEQDARADRVAKLADVRVEKCETISAEGMAEILSQMLEKREHANPAELDFNGIDTASRMILEMLG